ncbi:MAG: hypothetical protein WBJ15_06305, partial [Limnochordia bacterium]
AIFRVFEKMFQPTHPHGVRRSVQAFSVIFIVVSTHAPARGATVERKVAVLRAVKHQISRTSLEREAAEPCYKTKACKSPVKAVLRIPLENQDHLRFAVRNQVINTPSGS